MLEAYLELLQQGYFEVGEAFRDLADENVWKRPAEGLLSVGELAGHVAHWEAVRLAGDGEDLAKCRVSSPLIDARFRYYPTTMATPPSKQHLAMTAEQVHAELVRVHNDSVAIFRALNPDLRTAPAPRDSSNDLLNSSYGEQLKYLVFHIAYHTGQIYSVRHLLGEQTPDN